MRLNIFLIKKDYKILFKYRVKDKRIILNDNPIFDDNVCLSGDDKIIAHITSLKKKPREVNKAECEYIAFYRNRESSTPEWKGFWQIENTIEQKTADAIVLLYIDDRIFFICHGYSYHLMNPYAIESNFGLRTVINMIDKDKITGTDLFNPGDTGLHTRKKVAGAKQIDEFEINYLNTMVRNISGQVQEKYEKYAKAIDGSDNLKINFNETPKVLESNLKEILDIYKKDDYKSNGFDWIDNFIVVKDLIEIKELDKKLIEGLNAYDEGILLSIPSILDYSGSFKFRISGFGYRKENASYEFDIKKTLFRYMKEKEFLFKDLRDFKSKKVMIVDYDDPETIITSAPLYNSLYFEIRNEKTWIFFESGVWYSVDEKFSKSIDNEISDLIENPLKVGISFSRIKLLKKYKIDKEMLGVKRSDRNLWENWFNNELTRYFNVDNTAQCLDADNVSVEGRNKIEVCDVLFHDGSINYLFHNKLNSGASALSHLFSQGNVSSELLSLSMFRAKVNQKIKNDFLKFPESDDDFDPRKYCIVYGIIAKRNKDDKFHLTLFSRVNLKIFYENIKSRNYGLKLCFFEEV